MEAELEFLEVNMCVVCLIEKVNLLAIDFDDSMGHSLGPILVKHLWFQMEELRYKYVCEDCWEQINHFHEFYVSMEKAHAGMKLVSQKQALDSFVKIESLPYQSEPDQKFAIVEEIVQTALAEPKTEDSEFPLEASLHESKVQLDAPTNEKPESTNPKSDSDDEEVAAATAGSDDFQPDQASSDSDSSEDEVPLKKRRKTRKKEPAATEAEKMEKIYHKSTEEILAESKQIDEHCKLGCTECNTSFSTFADFKKHAREIHGVSRPVVVCCNKRFTKRVRLVEHVKRFYNPNAFMCLICDKQFENSNNLKLHNMHKHAPTEALVYKCDHCEQSFARKFQLNAHMTKHVPEEDRNTKCDECQKTFVNKYSLQHHVKRVHLKEVHFFCDICAKFFYSKQALQMHRKTHSDSPPPEKVQCTECGSWHNNAMSLYKHKRRHHDGNKQSYQCPDCDKIAPSAEALRSHRRYVHETDRSHVCSICEKAFKKAINLKEHMAQHTGEYLYRCDYCERQFNSSANMFAHRKRAHPLQWEQDQKNVRKR